MKEMTEEQKSDDIPEALTFDDVLLAPSYSEILPKEVDISTFLTPNISLYIPLVSAAMDTVTEAPMAIAMGQEGGIGIIHRNLSIMEQATEVEKVKKHESGVIVHPLTVYPYNKILEAFDIMKKSNKTSLVVVEEDGTVVGIITKRDLWGVKELDARVDTAMTSFPDLITAREGIAPEAAKEILQKNKVEKLPLVDDKKRLRGLITMKDLEKAQEYPHASKDKLGRLRCGAAVGVGEDREERIEALLKMGCDVIVIDTAHGHSKRVIDAVRATKSNFRNIELIAGNIATAEAADVLIGAGADTVKVGIGPGSICTTRVIAGIGVPQISAIMDVVKIAGKKGTPVIADGGIKYSGDVTKALAAGGYSVMIGNLFAGTDEAPGETVLYQGKTYKTYRGMGSVEAMKRGSGDRYAQDEMIEAKLVPEGIEGRVPYRGKVGKMIYQLIGGLKAGMGYTGCATLPELRLKRRFIRVTAAGHRENHPHDVILIEDAPNYPIR